MPPRRAAFCSHHVVASVDLVEMRSLAPDRLLLGTDPLVDDDALGARHAFVLHEVVLAHADRAVPRILGLAVRCVVVVEDPGGLVIPEEEARVDAADRHLDRLAPALVRILRLVDDVAAVADHRDDEVERVVVRIVLDVRRKDAGGEAESLVEPELRDRVADIAAKVPVDEVLRVIDRNARIVAERAVRQVEVVTLARDRRIGRHADHDRVAVLRRGIARRKLLLAAAGESAEGRDGRTLRHCAENGLVAGLRREAAVEEERIVGAPTHRESVEPAVAVRHAPQRDAVDEVAVLQVHAEKRRVATGELLLLLVRQHAVPPRIELRRIRVVR